MHARAPCSRDSGVFPAVAIDDTDAAVLEEFSTLVDNAAFFGAALAVLLILSFLLSRLARRLAGPDPRGTEAREHAMLTKVAARQVSRVFVLANTFMVLATIAAAIILTVYGIDVVPPTRAWFESKILGDPVASSWAAGQVVLLLLGAYLVHGVLRFIVDLAIGRVLGDPTFLRHHEKLGALRDRAAVVVRWGVRFAALLGTSALLRWPAAVDEALTAATYVIVAVLLARALASLVDVGVDIGVQLVRALEGKRAPSRYLGRVDHIGSITKRTLEYALFVGAGTIIAEHLRPNTWLGQSGVVALRLLALVYVGRVLIEIVGLLLREALLADAERRTEAERQQRLTLVPIAVSLVRYAVYFCITVMGLQELGVDTSPILAGAGLLGLAVGLGAQAFVGDLVSGFFILFEGTFLVGDRIRVGDVLGIVEEIGVRVLKVRDEFGVLHCIPNGEVRLVATHARQYVNAVVDFTLPYDADVAAVLDRLRARMGEDRGLHADIVSGTQFDIEELRDTGALIRSATRVKPSRDEEMGDIIRAELITALGELGVSPSGCHVLKIPANRAA